MLNLALLVGRLGKPPEIRHTQDGKKVGSFRLATSEYYKGEEKTEWHSVTCWDEVLCDVLANRCKQGTLVAVVGTIRTRKYQAKDGTEKFSTEIIMDKFGSKLQVLAGGVSREERGPSDTPPKCSTLPDLDDEIPW